ncbi:MAG: Uma2 family endonuclease [Bacteroidota bacterium]
MKLPQLTPAEYLQRERASGDKYEFHDGRVYALAGGTVNHGLIGGNVYPDAMVICGGLEKSDEVVDALVNPLLIVEVLSKSTAEYDRGDKFYFYRQLPSFKEYILIEQDRYVVDVHYKRAQRDLWQITRYEGWEQRVKLQSLNLEISMEEWYFRVELEA